MHWLKAIPMLSATVFGRFKPHANVRFSNWAFGASFLFSFFWRLASWSGSRFSSQSIWLFMSELTQPPYPGRLF